MKCPSLVRYWFVSGFGDAKWPWCGSSSTSRTLAPEIVMLIAHIPADISDTSTMVPAPVRSRWNRAALMPPARAMPDWRSPKPGPAPVLDPVEAALAGERATRALRRAPAIDDPSVAPEHVVRLDAELGAGRR